MNKRLTIGTVGSILLIGGFLLCLDGIGSIIVYWTQTPLEHAIRVLRTLYGVVNMICGGYLLHRLSMRKAIILSV